MEGKQTVVQFKGIVRNTPAAMAQDGEQDEMLNLRFKDGVLRPILAGSPLNPPHGDLLAYKNVYIHSNQGFKHLLGVNAAGKLCYFADMGGEDGKTVTMLAAAAELLQLTDIEARRGVQYVQTGNIVTVNAGEDLKYVFWVNNTYKALEMNFNGEVTDKVLGPVKVELRVVYENLGDIFKDTIYADGLPYSVNTGEWMNDIRTRQSLATSLFMTATGKNQSRGKLSGFCMAISVIELFDGNYILLSNPVLLGQADDINTRYDFTPGGGNTYKYDGNKLIFNPAFYKNIHDIIEDGYYKNVEAVCESSNLNTTPADYTERHRRQPNIYCYTERGTGNPGTVIDTWVNCVWKANVLKYRISNQTNLKEYENLINGVSIFITPEISMYDFVEERAQYTGEALIDINGIAGGATWVENFIQKIKSSAEIITELTGLSFYKIHEISYTELQKVTPDTWIDIDLKGKLGDNLLMQEELAVMPNPHINKYSYINEYNSQLHAANYRQELFHGFPLNYFQIEQGLGQFAILQYWSFDIINYAFGIEVWLKTENGNSKVVRLNGQLNNKLIRGTNTMLSYPDRRAYKMLIFQYIKNSAGIYFISREFDLKSSKTQNFAYYISPELKPIDFAPIKYESAAELPMQNFAPAEENNTVIRENGLNVSAVNNPIYFPNGNAYTAGNGRIVGVSSNAVALSTGQFGEFPLYVFCSDGIYAMFAGSSTGADTAYLYSRPVARDVCIDAKSITPIDGGVLFATGRGLMVIQGSTVMELSERVKGIPFKYNNENSNDYINLFKLATTNDALVNFGNMTDIDFTDFMKNIIIACNYPEKEVWVINPEQPYCYIYSIKYGVWYKAKFTGTEIIHDYPFDYVLHAGKIIDFASPSRQPSAEETDTVIITRPLNFGSKGFKRITRAVMRGYFKSFENINSYLGIYVAVSNDCAGWKYLCGKELRIPAQENNDIADLGTLTERAGYRYYRICFAGKMASESHIDYLEAQGLQDENLQGKIR